MGVTATLWLLRPRQLEKANEKRKELSLALKVVAAEHVLYTAESAAPTRLVFCRRRLLISGR